MYFVEIFELGVNVIVEGFYWVLSMSISKEIIIDRIASGFVSKSIINDLEECDEDCLKELITEYKNTYGDDSCKNGKPNKFIKFIELINEYDELSPYLEDDYSLEIKLVLAFRKSIEILQKIIIKLILIALTVCAGIMFGYISIK